MILKNKKGAEKILAVYWFAILILVSAGVFSMVFSFQAPYDVRELEASVLTGQVADCVSEQGILDYRLPEAFGISSIEKIEDPTTDFKDINKSITEDASCKCDDNSCIKYAGWIAKYSGKNENNIVDPLLMAGLMVQESFCNPGSESDSSYGLVQINLKEHCDKGYGNWGLSKDSQICRNELKNLEKNIDVGTQILKSYYDEFGEKGLVFDGACNSNLHQKTYYGWEAALRAYNGNGCGVFGKGPREGERITSQDAYVEHVLERYNNLRKILGKNPITGSMKIDLQEMCHLNFEAEEKNPQYYFEIEFTNFSSGEFLGVAKEGNPNLKTDCILQDEKESKTLSKCIQRSFYSVGSDNEKYTIKILSVVRKTEQNVDG